jgi:ribose ABC superfamily ATP binding cassette transporter, permease protein
MPTPDRPLIRHPLLRQYGGIVIALIILCTVFTIANSRFLSLANFMNIFQQVAVVAIAAFGMTWVILLGEIDLSVGSIIAVAGMVGAQSLALGTGFPAALLITIIAGAILGAVNGLLTARLLLPSFIVTVATMSIYRGLVSLPTGGAPLMISDPNWQAIGASHFLGVPLIIWILLVLFLANHIALSMTVFGRETYLTGGNREAALYSGIRVNRIKIIIFTLSGVMSAIAGILLSSRLYSAQTNAGLSYELDAIAAVVVGGTSLMGGKGKITGTLIGALIIGFLNNALNLLDVSAYYQTIAKSIVILVAVLADNYLGRKTA